MISQTDIIIDTQYMLGDLNSEIIISCLAATTLLDCDPNKSNNNDHTGVPYSHNIVCLYVFPVVTVRF